MEKRLNDNKWVLLAWSSLAVAGTYILLDIYNKKQLQAKRKSKKFIFQQEKDESFNSSYGKILIKTIYLSYKAEISSQMPDPLPIGGYRKLNKNEHDYNIHKICITGGPCAGKTTGEILKTK